MTHASDAAVADVEAHDAERRLDALIDDLGFTDSAVGRSPGWRGVLRRAIQVAATDTTTCLEGESGVGKEVVARLIHCASPRRHGPFVAINCAAIPESLLESELFGFERGAFTGAHQAKPGQIEVAAGGVLFLDEVSEMTLGAQAKVLRVLEEREFRRLGATRLFTFLVARRAPCHRLTLHTNRVICTRRDSLVSRRDHGGSVPRTKYSFRSANPT
jgi:transcriptional regulator with PAS, ATPase and Fis domain